MTPKQKGTQAKPVKKEYRAVYVEWIDSTMDKKVWHECSDLFQTTSESYHKFKTIAYLVSKNKLEYIFANSIHFEKNEDKFTPVSFGQIFTIPIGCVVVMKNITINR